MQTIGPKFDDITTTGLEAIEDAEEVYEPETLLQKIGFLWEELGKLNLRSVVLGESTSKGKIS